MPCLFPKQVTVTKKDGSKMSIPAPCGRCPECLKKNRMDWYIRNKVELQNAENAFFITLTYNENNLPISESNHQPCFSVRHIQLFLKRFRKNLQTTPKFKYFLASEYGGNFGRPHYHALFYNIPNEKISSLPELLAQNWSYGFVSVSPITDRRISYVCKYMLQKTQRKKDYNDSAQAPFYLCSRRPAIGIGYLNDDNILYHLANKTTKFNLFGLNCSMPQYYKRKIFDDYPDIKDEIRNDYLTQIHNNFIRNCATASGYKKYCDNHRNTIKASLQKFKKYSKQKFEGQLTPELEFIYRNTY